MRFFTEFFRSRSKNQQPEGTESSQPTGEVKRGEQFHFFPIEADENETTIAAVRRLIGSNGSIGIIKIQAEKPPSENVWRARIVLTYEDEPIVGTSITVDALTGGRHYRGRGTAPEPTSNVRNLDAWVDITNVNTIEASNRLRQRAGNPLPIAKGQLSQTQFKVL